MIHYNKNKSYVIKNENGINYVIYTYTSREIKIKLNGKILIDREFKRSKFYFDDAFTAIWAYIIIALHNEYLSASETPISYKKHNGEVVFTQHGLGVAVAKLICLLILIWGILL